MPRGARSALQLLVVAAGVLLAAAPARAQAKDGKPTPPDTEAITPATVAAGRTLFHGKGTCHLCHGEQLEGSPAAPALHTKTWKDATGGTFPQIYRVITSGVDGTAMVPHPGGISDTEAIALASYIWSVNNRGVKP